MRGGCSSLSGVRNSGRPTLPGRREGCPAVTRRAEVITADFSGAHMSEVKPDIDNAFTPYVQPDDTASELGIVFVTIAAAFFTAAFGLCRAMGVF